MTHGHIVGHSCPGERDRQTDRQTETETECVCVGGLGAGGRGGGAWVCVLSHCKAFIKPRSEATSLCSEGYLIGFMQFLEKKRIVGKLLSCSSS